LLVAFFVPLYQALQRTSIDGDANLHEPTYLAVKILDFPAAMPLSALLSANRSARSLSNNYRGVSQKYERETQAAKILTF
jgi:hypothetical protein